MRLLLVLALFLVMGCSDDEPFFLPPPPPPGGVGPCCGSPQFAPRPPNGGYPVPTGFRQVPYNYPQGGFPTQFPYAPNSPGYPFGPNVNPWGTTNFFNNGFNPNFSTGLGTGYYPFLPIYDWMRRDPRSLAYWNQLWLGWQQFCRMHGISPNQFGSFWGNYIPQYVGTQTPWVQYYSQQFYPWYQAGQTLPAQVDPWYFWQYYAGAPYTALDEYYWGDPWVWGY